MAKKQHLTLPRPSKNTGRLVVILLLCLGLAPFLSFCLMVLGGIAIGLGERGVGDEPLQPEFLFHPTRIPRWSADGSSIVFDRSDGKIYVVDSDGSHLRSISKGSGKYDIDYSPDISPDGSLIVYSTLRHKTGFLWNAKNNLEIVTSRLDGSREHRLTKNKAMDTYPVWSPDGRSIAFLSDRSGARFHIYVMDHNGDQQRAVVSSLQVAEAPLVWSPDGSMIAFRTVEDGQIGDEIRYWSDVYTVRVDGSNLTRIGSTISDPVWSPDGRRVALIDLDQGTSDGKLYTVGPDGSAPRTILLIRGDDLDSNIAWSPDGSQILVGSWIIDVDGSARHRLPDISDVLLRMIYDADVVTGLHYLSSILDTIVNTWSPDGSMIAINVVANAGQIMVSEDSAGIYNRSRFSKEYVTLHTIFHDGSDRRILVKQNTDGSLSAENGKLLGAGHPATTIYFDESGRPMPAPFDIEQCSNGVVVPDPEVNHQLVEDCEILLLIQDSLGSDFPLNWSTDIPISDWEGITVFVRGIGEIRLSGRYLTGAISPEFGNLSALVELNLRDNLLHGEIPAELGNLASLHRLYLGSNKLEGEIPVELGNLTNLQELDLSENELEGKIPGELGNLLYLKELALSDNRLTSVPEELAMRNLRWIWLEGNPIEGCIPGQILEKMARGDSSDNPFEPCEN